MVLSFSHREPPALLAEIEVGATAVAFRQTVRLFGTFNLSRARLPQLYVQ
jgi:hypothetical protein